MIGVVVVAVRIVVEEAEVNLFFRDTADGTQHLRCVGAVLSSIHHFQRFGYKGDTCRDVCIDARSH